MKKPIIIVVDDDPQVLKAVSRDIKNEFRKEYRILSTTSANEALETIETLKKQDEVIALLVSDQRMPEMLGVEFLEKAKVFFPSAKKVLLTAYSDTDAAIKAINDVQLDFYLMKPWDPPEEKLYPILNDLLEEWNASYIPNFEGIRIIGHPYSPKAHTLKDFLAGNLFPYLWIDFTDEEGASELVNLHNITFQDLPTVILPKGEILKNPSLSDLAKAIGMKPDASDSLYDVTSGS